MNASAAFGEIGKTPAVASRLMITLAVMSATLIQVLDTTIVNVALPHMQGELGATSDQISWVLTSYLVSSAIFMPLTGYFTDVWGRKRFLLICITGFVAASALCGISQSVAQIVFFRLLQGIFGAALVPLSQAIMADAYPPHERGKAMAIWGLGVMVGPVAGPTLGGWLTDTYSWRYAFYINIPVGILAIYMINRFVHDPHYITKTKAPAFDRYGFAALVIWTGCLQVVLDKGQEDDWFASKLITFFVVVMIIAFVTMIWWELKQLREGHRPIVNLTLFKRRNFAISFGLMFVLGFTLYGTTILIPQFVQTLLGYTAELAGMVLSPAGFMMMAMMPVVGILSSKVDPRKLIAYGFLSLTASLVVMHTMDLQISYGRLVFLRMFQASGLAFLFIPINMIAYIGVKQSENNDVSGLTNLARNIGGSCGTAFVATMLTRLSAAHETNMIRNLSPGNPAFVEQVKHLKGMFGGGHGGGNPMLGNAAHTAQAYIYNQMHRQAGMLAYLDIIQYLAVFCALMLPLLFFIPKPPAHLDPGAGH